MNSLKIVAIVLVALAVIFSGCSLPEKIAPTAPTISDEPGPPATLSLSKAGVILSGNTQIYSGFTTPRDSWQNLNNDGYSVPTVIECYFALRSGTTANDSMLVGGIEVVTENGSYQMAHYSTTVSGSFFWLQPLPDGSIAIPRGNNLSEIVWVTIGTSGMVSKSTLDNWAGTEASVRLPMVRGSIARCWVDDRNGKGVTDVLVTTWTARTGGSQISELRPTHWVPSGDGWVLEFEVDPSGAVKSTGADNTHITIRP
ncbi:MAG TPA: hypothetical protein PLF15_02680 [bacterium]|nr:hypothetical protein [bacterium]